MLTLSSQNFIAYSLINGEKYDSFYEIYVSILSEPCLKYKVCEIYNKVVYLEWSPGGSCLLIVENYDGNHTECFYRISVWRPLLDLLSNDWKCEQIFGHNIDSLVKKTCTHDNISDSDLNTVIKFSKCISVTWLQNNKLVHNDFSICDNVSYQEKIYIPVSKPCVSYYGLPQEGFIYLTSDAMIHVCVRNPLYTKDDNDRRPTSKKSSNTVPVYITKQHQLMQSEIGDIDYDLGDISFKNDGKMVIALCPKFVTSAVVFFEVTVTYEKGEWDISSDRLNGLFPFSTPPTNPSTHPTALTPFSSTSSSQPMLKSSVPQPNTNNPNPIVSSGLDANKDYHRGSKIGLKFAGLTTSDLVFIASTDPVHNVSRIELWRLHEISSKIHSGFPIEKFTPRKKRVWSRMSSYESASPWIISSLLIPISHVRSHVGPSTTYQDSTPTSVAGNSIPASKVVITSPPTKTVIMAWTESRKISEQLGELSLIGQKFRDGNTVLTPNYHPHHLKIVEWQNVETTNLENLPGVAGAAYGKTVMAGKPNLPQLSTAPKVLQTIELRGGDLLPVQHADPTVKFEQDSEHLTLFSASGKKRKRDDDPVKPSLQTDPHLPFGLACSIHKTCLALSHGISPLSKGTVTDKGPYQCPIAIYPIADVYYSAICGAKVMRGTQQYAKVMTQLMESSLFTKHDVTDIILAALPSKSHKPNDERIADMKAGDNHPSPIGAPSIHVHKSVITSSFLTVLNDLMKNFDVQPTALKKALTHQYLTLLNQLAAAFSKYHNEQGDSKITSDDNISSSLTLPYFVEALPLKCKLKLFVSNVRGLFDTLLAPVDFSAPDHMMSLVSNFLSANAEETDVEKLTNKFRVENVTVDNSLHTMFDPGRCKSGLSLHEGTPNITTAVVQYDLRSLRPLFQWTCDIAYHTLLCFALLLCPSSTPTTSNDRYGTDVTAVRSDAWRVRLLYLVKNVLIDGGNRQTTDRTDGNSTGSILRSLKDLLFFVGRCCAIEPQLTPSYFNAPPYYDSHPPRSQIGRMFSFLVTILKASKEAVGVDGTDRYYEVAKPESTATNPGFLEGLTSRIGNDAIDNMRSFFRSNLLDPINLCPDLHFIMKGGADHVPNLNTLSKIGDGQYFLLNTMVCNGGQRVDALTYNYLPSVVVNSLCHTTDFGKPVSVMRQCLTCRSRTVRMDTVPATHSTSRKNVVNALWLPRYNHRCLCGGFWKCL